MMGSTFERGVVRACLSNVNVEQRMGFKSPETGLDLSVSASSDFVLDLNYYPPVAVGATHRNYVGEFIVIKCFALVAIKSDLELFNR